MTTLWKSLKKGLKSEDHNGKQHKWKVGKWYHAEGEISCYNNGFHASERIIDAMSFVKCCEELALVEVKGICNKEKNEQAWSDMKIIKSWKWTKKDSVKLAIFSAEQVIDIYEKKYPNDKRPREAIEAAKNWLKNPTEKNRLVAVEAAKAAELAMVAAWEAETVRMAELAESTWATGWVAKAAARAAKAVWAAGAWAVTELARKEATWAATWAAVKAAEWAKAAVMASADNKVLEKIEEYIKKDILKI